ncbi:g6377 [Coccomyxa elongata]
MSQTRRAKSCVSVSAAARSVQAGAALAEVEAPPSTLQEQLGNLSYSAQYDRLFQQRSELDTKKPVPKPSKEAQQEEDGAKKVLLSDVYATAKSPLFGRKWNGQDYGYTIFMLVVHGLCLLAPFTFSWPMVGLFFGTYFITGCLGITLSFHRQLSHRSFTTPKWLEYALAYCGVLAVQGEPIEWVSSHRYHHLHTDTPLDPHSPYEGFWWSHMGWLLDNGATLERVGSRGNTGDLDSQPFYKFIQRTYAWHVVAMFAALYAFGGLPALVWGGALRAVWVYHITWFVNSASHCWGYQTYNTGDLSRNNWWVAVLAFGEGWHNNHHAFEFSARHGMEWWQFDVTWQIIAALKAVGLADNVKLPSEKQKARLAFPSAS